MSATGSKATTNPFRYASGYTDPNGLIKFGTRYYQPTLGRWTQQDPIPGVIDNPNTLDRYPYVGDNPINLGDPTGLDDCAAVGLGSAVGGAISGAAAGRPSAPRLFPEPALVLLAEVLGAILGAR